MPADSVGRRDILRVEPEGFVGGWDVAREKKRSQDDCKVLGLRN